MMTVSGFFDESGKFKDKKVICVGGVSSYRDDFENFAQEWGRQLYLNGVSTLTAKQALKHHVPLGKKKDALGIEKRTDALIPFITAIRKNLQVISGISIDAVAFKKLPPHFYKFYGTNPSFMAFARLLQQVVGFTPPKDRIVMTCDEDEETTIPFYDLYKRVKKIWPSARNKLAAISFADDRYLFALQAADLVAGLLRLETDRILNQSRFDYSRLFDALRQPPQKYERAWTIEVVVGTDSILKQIAEATRTEWERLNREQEEK